MSKKSAGILLFRISNGEVSYFLVHPGGPFYKNKDLGCWSIPKGEIGEDEDPLVAAKREFEEETGRKPEGDFLPLTPIKQKGGKMVYAWAVEGDLQPEYMKSNLFSLEWPPGTGKFKEFPEADRGEWFTLEEAAGKILPAQYPLLKELSIAIDGLLRD